MKKILLTLGLVSMSQFSVASTDLNCNGKVSWVMADNANCGGFAAFKTEATGGKQGKWMCTKSKSADDVALAALINDKTVEVYIDGSDVATCTDLPHYRKINYIIINP